MAAKGQYQPVARPLFLEPNESHRVLYKDRDDNDRYDQRYCLDCLNPHDHRVTQGWPNQKSDEKICYEPMTGKPITAQSMILPKLI